MWLKGWGSRVGAQGLGLKGWLKRLAQGVHRVWAQELAQ